MFQQFEVNNASNTKEEKNSEGDSNYKIYYDKRPVKCIWCNISVRADSMPRHEKSKKHLKNKELKYKVVSNGKEYVYEKAKRKTMKEILSDPVKKDKHYKLLKKKIDCEICGTNVAYSSMWRHKKSTKCLINKK
jgi:hypothetical protein